MHTLSNHQHKKVINTYSRINRLPTEPKTYYIIAGIIGVLLLICLGITVYKAFISPGYLIRGEYRTVSLQGGLCLDGMQSNAASKKLFYIVLLIVLLCIIGLLTYNTVSVYNGRINRRWAEVDRIVNEARDEIAAMEESNLKEVVDNGARFIREEYKNIQLDKYIMGSYSNCILTKDSIIHAPSGAAGPVKVKIPVTGELLISLILSAQNAEFTRLIEKHPLYTGLY
ncbi:uncharacterized protein NEPG_01777 [Nematocida parisii ERTm1]|uniref:Uncharacterized protein n=1 Tax=Nematocida parisii (strain ERTm3) TaxID=935791 RepID=I3EIG4_NEMP3|nr:uncharacterized protein NEPG_01777 [Nematocida parisii ERTm1]EIJ89011.1 hypothetical protein NEQG_00830 [Nematocida parisii ERTm3]EIJ93435.1 hypothetical protein NEPG_01777 [Nematocida parisii ERTm1]KAI5156184.1 hypothetical protein NEPAR05_0361 [Nematocida parisii]|eukprot:XP_013059605.1 hypothetical protein NEPG_01777 [Nematocida parisii ERTm1]